MIVNARLILLGVLVPLAGPERGMAQAGISQALARQRAAGVRDVRYDLAVDLTALDSAVGRVTVRFQRSSRAGEAVLDFRGRRLTRVLANGRPLSPDAARDGHILVPAELLRPGENALEFGFVADIAPSGASIIRSHDPSDGSDYLYTLLVPADAHQLFPSFDQPDLKARVRLTLTAPAGWSVVANGAIETADTVGERVTTRFAEPRVCLVTGPRRDAPGPELRRGAAELDARSPGQTAAGSPRLALTRPSGAPTPAGSRQSESCEWKPAPISTYLIAFAVGPWSAASSTHSGRTVTAYLRRSRAKEADVDTLLALNHRALDWMERYFGRPYPFEKYDFVIAPAFPFGGMEHPGAVFYSEDRFIFRERPTLPRRLARFSTILHEAAHQWFGDLVTMRWFDDLWLKEGFATFMAAKALADIDPAADAWKTFYLGNKPSAYAVDQTAGTRPLWQELENLDQAKSNYGAIVYNKAPAVLKQLEYLVGDSAFQRGVRRFLEQHPYGNATWQELLGAIGEASGRDLTQFGRDFMLRPGMPVVEQQLDIKDGKVRRLALTQRPAQPLSGPKPWTQRTEALLFYKDESPVRIPAELHHGVTEVTEARGRPAPDFVFANAQDYGYFLLLLDSSSVRSLENGALSQVNDAFLRAMLWGSLWDQVRNFRMPPERFVQLALKELPSESDEQIVPFVLARVDRAMSAYLPPMARNRVQPAVERMLWTAAADTARPYGIRKAYLDYFVSLAKTPGAVAMLSSLFSADSAAGEPLKDPTRWEIVTRLLDVGAPTADQRLAEQTKRDTTPDGRRRGFIAQAARPTAENKREYFTRYFADSTLNEDWASGSLGAFNSLEHQALALPYLRPALDSLPFIQRNRRIFYLESWLGAFLRGQTSDSALGVVRQYLTDHPDLPQDLRRKVLQHMDELERTVRIRRGATGSRSPPPS
jgi:aminopeptidase N